MNVKAKILIGLEMGMAHMLTYHLRSLLASVADPSIAIALACFIFLVWFFVSTEAALRSAGVLAISHSAQLLPPILQSYPALASRICPDPDRALQALTRASCAVTDMPADVAEYE